jgi:hypothetical protein
MGHGMDHIMPAPTTYSMTSGGYNTMIAMYKENECHLSIKECVNNDKKDINVIYLLCRLKINHMTRCKLCIYS